MSRRIVRLAAEFGRCDVLCLLGGASQDPQQIGQPVDIRQQPLTATGSL